ncbi:MAG: DUF938 domain-containing protein [Wenzhouxiangellaceae bacterium]|nr:DUF938 domain-containing protein [Wenzhouxiangellaceae bacterium]
MTDRPHSEAAARNRVPIADALARALPPTGRLLEIGSGTGQHACYCAARLHGWGWQPSEHPGMLQTLNAGLADSPDNVEAPLTLDVAGEWPGDRFDAVFSANTAHIMHWPEVEAMFSGVARVLNGSGCFLLYGPFKRDGIHHADSNAAFDASLQARDPGMGVRDLVDVDALAGRVGLMRTAELLLPANNHILMFQHREVAQ